MTNGLRLKMVRRLANGNLVMIICNLFIMVNLRQYMLMIGNKMCGVLATYLRMNKMTKIVKLHYQLKISKAGSTSCCNGFFDGVHRGHQAVIQRAKTTANQLGVPLAVLTYDPHPVVVFKTLTEPLRYLTTLSQKAALLTELGVDTMYVMQFTSQLAQLSPQTFVDDVVMRANNHCCCWFDHLYGVIQIYLIWIVYLTMLSRDLMWFKCRSLLTVIKKLVQR